MGFQLIKAPAVEPVTLVEAKAYARISTSAEDDMILGLITAAREFCETFTNRKFITQSWRMYLDAFPGYIDQRLGGNIVSTPIAIGATSYMAGIRWAITPEYSPVQGIDALTYISTDNTPVVMTESVDYWVDKISNPARVSPTYGKFWPISRIQANAVYIDWTAGWGGPIVVSMTQGSAVLDGAKFYQSDVGKAITITGAGTGAGSPVVYADLVTSISSVDASGVATLADAAITAVSDVGIYWGDPVPRSICSAIMALFSAWYNNREAMTENTLTELPIGVSRLLSPYRDIRL